MATDFEIRRELKAAGIEVTQRGKLGDEYREAYRQLMESRGAGGEDVSGPAAAGGEPAAAPAGTGPERRPRRATSHGRPRSVWQRLAGGTGKRGKARPRVSVDRLCERGWEMLSRLAGPTPMGRCLSMQSPVAGLILEDVVAGTMVDRALQPIARAEHRAEKVFGLAGPPMIVGALQAAQGLPDGQRQMREAFLLPLLRESMAVWVDIAGDKVAAKAQRDAEMGPVYAQVDELISMIFAPPSASGYVQDDLDGQDQAAAAEDEAARNAQAFASAS